MAVKFLSVPSKRLAASINASSTTIQLNNILGWDGVALSSSIVGDKLYAVLRNDANTAIEIMELDPTTIASASITITRRGLGFDGDLTTETTANKLTWIKNETIVELGTNPPQLYAQFVKTSDAQTVDGVKTYSSFPLKSGSVTPSALNEFATKSYVDSVVTGTTNYDQQTMSGVAGETLVAGNFVYYKTSDQRWWKTDSDALGTAAGVKLGVAMGSASAGASFTILLAGVEKNQSGLTAGSHYFLGSTAGGIQTTVGTFRRFVGRALSATEVLLDFTQDLDVVKNDGSSAYGADAGSNDTYVITLAASPISYKAGMMFTFKANTRNTGACTLNVNSVGAVTIKKEGTLDLADGDIEAGAIYTVVYDGTNFQLMNPKGSAPTGSMMMWVGASAPTGWLLCDASAVSRTTYATLYSVIGDTYGNGDGSTTFNVPDMRGRVPIGVGTGIGDGASGTGLPAGGTTTDVIARATWKGSKTHTLTTSEMPAHTHGSSLLRSGTGIGRTDGPNFAQAGNTDSAGGDGAHNNVQPVMGVNFIIKT